MQRVALGIGVGIAIWLGSAFAADAQSITPIGPTSVKAGDTSTQFKATVTLATPCHHWVNLIVDLNGVQKHTSHNYVPNPGITNYTYTKTIDTSTWGLVAGDTLVFKSKLYVGGIWYTGQNWTVTVSATRPTSVSSAHPQMRQGHGLVVAAVDRDRRLQK